MAYSYRFPIGIYWMSRDGKTEHSCFYESTEIAEERVQSIKEHNKAFGHASWDTNYIIRPRTPVSRKGAGRKRAE